MSISDMRTKAIIHLDRFIQNINLVKTRTNRRICVPVKADGYGHGALEIAKTAVKTGVDYLGVATAAEGAELRKGGITSPILLFSQPHPAEIPQVIEASLIPFVSDRWFADALSGQAGAEKLKVHLKIDTGMGRLGCRMEEAVPLARHIVSCPSLELAGTATHFSVSDSQEPDDIKYTQTQISLFNETVASLKDAGIDPGIVHAANSGAVLLHPDSWYDMVRPGILLYGYLSEQAQPVMELRTSVSLIKKIKKGESVSYGRAWTAQRDTFIGVLSAGYDDGLPRLASGKWQAVIGGKTYPLAGRICMDQCCVDLGENHEVKLWEEAVLFGGDAPSAADLARTVGTIPYEITCNINKRVKRVYTENYGG